ncbi:DNA-directed DNA polymerase [Novosphingobium endophyticum]|uniref:DNA-directed DNA polymerase n=1 Tax=Novosphingobium endophyticum TaxID=1955250 RepID=A0A916X6Q0_9SPHN|nr:DNA polymerase Y family protein [Novosphingobium endophyticum]GGC07876.1 DNA-directed DNA polymerase [Novosphingobium endophyticum]
MKRRYLALWLPYLSCERARQTAGPSIPAPPEPFALVERSGNALRLAAVDASAQAMGLVAGMALADARARCPGLATLPHDPEADRRELGGLVAAMAHVTPMAAADPPDGIVLDITGCAHLLGGERELAGRAAELARYSLRHAFAGNAAAARALVRHGNGSEDIHALPVAALELEAAALIALRRAGLTRIGDLARRPMAGLAARFGEEAVVRLREILGETRAPIAPHVIPAPVRAEARFAEPIARTDDVLDVIEDLLGRLERDMAARAIGGRRFVATLCRSDGARRRLAVETGQPVRDPPTVMRLMRERIETLADPLDPGFGFDAITLAVPRAEPLAARQIALDRSEAAGESVAALIDRLGVRLGMERVRRIVPRDRHLPEKAQALVPAAGGKDNPSSRRTPGPLEVFTHALAERSRRTTAGVRRDDGGDILPRPLYLLDPPQPVSVVAGVPDGPPQRFRWRGQLHEVRLAEGPERIAAEWWRRRGGHLPGEAGPTRDYYRIEDSAGRRYWLFRSGLFEERPDPRWYLHGLFP